MWIKCIKQEKSPQFLLHGNCVEYYIISSYTLVRACIIWTEYKRRATQLSFTPISKTKRIVHTTTLDKFLSSNIVFVCLIKTSSVYKSGAFWLFIRHNWFFVYFLWLTLTETQTFQHPLNIRYLQLKLLKI